jgi:hypothetical protein
LCQAEAGEHDGKPSELGEVGYLTEREKAYQQREARHQRGKHRGAAGAEQHHRAGEEIDRAGAGENALHDKL